MKKLSIILSLSLLAACQAGDTPIQSQATFAQASATAEPAMDKTPEQDHASLPENFPILREMSFTSAPKGCRLAKPAAFKAGGDIDYVFTSNQNPEMDSGYYQVAVNGDIRTIMQTKVLDTDAKKIRYFKTVDEPIVELYVETEALVSPEGDIRHTGTVSRIKAWDEEFPILCHYAFIPVKGDCDL